MIPVADFGGALVCVLGTIAQLLVGRRLRIPPLLNYLIALGILFIYPCDEENMMQAVRHPIPKGCMHQLVLPYM